MESGVRVYRERSMITGTSVGALRASAHVNPREFARVTHNKYGMWEMYDHHAHARFICHRNQQPPGTRPALF